MGLVGQVHADQEFGGGDRCDQDVIVIGDDAIEVLAGTLGGDENGRVEDQSRHARS